MQMRFIFLSHFSQSAYTSMAGADIGGREVFLDYNEDFSEGEPRQY